MKRTEYDKNFKVGSKVTFELDSGIILKGEVQSGRYLIFDDTTGCDFNHSKSCKLLEQEIGMSLHDLQEKTLGYKDELGLFPYCKSFEDLKEFILAF